ncbi:hypothetical protein [Parabacteroides sp. AM08-6]|uniref:hypothetical protein n=1 Tax=Parabacteroides sp. AM08-6 TaxID=2292053 RepID=UPI001F22682F|nr:hypothetical protein [Parabacteroides sp. AM08-6]
MKILDLPLKAQWYDMIESGKKKEEYRDNNRYWNRRLYKCLTPHPGHYGDCQDFHGNIIYPCWKCEHSKLKQYTHIRFRYGYTKRTMLFKLDNISIGKGNPNWGAPEHEVFILKLGEK